MTENVDPLDAIADARTQADAAIKSAQARVKELVDAAIADAAKAPLATKVQRIIDDLTAMRAAHQRLADHALTLPDDFRGKTTLAQHGQVGVALIAGMKQWLDDHPSQTDASDKPAA